VWEGKRICGACDYKKGVEREKLEEEKNDLIKKKTEQPSIHKKSVTVTLPTIIHPLNITISNLRKNLSEG
jgi:hypothetical protein